MTTVVGCPGDRGASRPDTERTASGTSDRCRTGEVEVLRLLAESISYTEIGKELLISRNTVRSHVQHVYTKLGASGRTDAVDTARKLGLI
jgi:DNA-binding CsgD family transcriptional regulator